MKPVITPVEVLPAVTAPLPAMGKRVAKKLASSPLAVDGTWESARRWLDHSKYLQEAALFCQVMLGLELIALRESTPKTAHRPRKGETPANVAGVSFTAIAEKETGLSERTIRTFIRMAESALPRLRKHIALRGFDPQSQSLAPLPGPQKDALSAAVKKLTDGMTQQDFLVELGLAKAPQGSAVKGGARERKAPLPPEEQAEVEAGFARKDFQSAIISLRAIDIRFTLIPDAELEPLVLELESRLAIHRKWIETPESKRDIAAFELLLASA